MSFIIHFVYFVDIQVFALETTSLLRKYIGIFDLPFSILASRICLVLSFSNVMQARVRIMIHTSDAALQTHVD